MAGAGGLEVLGGGGVAVHVSLHFGLLGPESSWSGVIDTGGAVTSGQSGSSHLPAPSFSIWALYIQMGTERDL